MLRRSLLFYFPRLTVHYISLLFHLVFVAFQQYIVRVDKMCSGYIGFAPDAKLLLHRQFDDTELAEIEEKVAGLVDRESVSSSQPPAVSSDFIEKQENQIHDFDT